MGCAEFFSKLYEDHVRPEPFSVSVVKQPTRLISRAGKVNSITFVLYLALIGLFVGMTLFFLTQTVVETTISNSFSAGARCAALQPLSLKFTYTEFIGYGDGLVSFNIPGGELLRMNINMQQGTIRANIVSGCSFSCSSNKRLCQ